MNDLVKWLREQVDEDERLAQVAVREGGPDWSAGSAWLQEMIDPLPSTRRDRPNWTPILTEADAEHIARHDPARVLREIEAKRRILNVVGGWRHYSCPDGYYSCSQATEENGFEIDEACADEDRAGQPCDCGLERRQAAILGPLALPYAERPGYREEVAAMSLTPPAPPSGTDAAGSPAR